MDLYLSIALGVVSIAYILIYTKIHGKIFKTIFLFATLINILQIFHSDRVIAYFINFSIILIFIMIYLLFFFKKNVRKLTETMKSLSKKEY